MGRKSQERMTGYSNMQRGLMAAQQHRQRKISKVKYAVFRIRWEYFGDVKSGVKTIEYRKASDFWRPRLKDADVAVFLCGKQVHRRRILFVEEIPTPDWFSSQGRKEVDTPTCFAVHLGKVFDKEAYEKRRRRMPWSRGL